MKIGEVIGGDVGSTIKIRLKSNANVNVGDLVVCEDKITNEKFFLKIIDMEISSSIGQQFVEEIAGQKLERNVDYEILDKEERFYRMSKAKLLKIEKDGKFYPPRSLPNVFSEVRKIKEDEFDFINEEGEIEIGYLRLGKELVKGIKTKLPAKKLISHHMLVVAATGKGKSNFTKVFLRGLLKLDSYAGIVFDPHNEYFGGEGVKGLRDHPLREKIVYFSPRYEEIPGAERLIISTTDLEPDDLFGIVDLSGPQMEALIHLKKQEKESNWIKMLLELDADELVKFLGEKAGKGTILALKRKISRALELYNVSQGIVFTTEKTEGASIYDKIKSAVEERKIIIIDTSMIGDESEKIVASSILNRIFTSFRYAKQKNPREFERLPEVLVVFEEAPRVLGSEVLSKGVNVFERIAREGRKFKIGLCAITQMPSLISPEILSQMNTKVILGLPAPADRNAVINSAAQNISDESVEIQMLDRGEAIITSPFIKFPLPTKIFKFEDVLEEDKKYVEERTIDLAPY